MLPVDVIMPYLEHNSWTDAAVESIRKNGGNLVKVRRNDNAIYVGHAEASYIEENNPITPFPSYESIYEQINLGFTLVENKSKYVLVFGSDDIMYNGMLQEMVNVAEHSNAKVVYCDYEMMTANGNHMDYVRINPRYEFGLNCKTSHYPDVSLFRRDVVEEFGGWDVSKGRYAMWWLWLQIGRKYAKDIYHCPYFGFRYRQHEGGMHNRERQNDRVAFVNSIREWLGNVPSGN